MKIDNRTIWNEAARVGLVFGLFSSVCLVLKEASALTGSTFVVQLAAVVLWAVEFFGCILLMKKYMLDLRDKFEGVTQMDAYRFGRRIALLSGLVLAAVDAFIIMKIPEETIAEVVNEVAATLGASVRDQMDRMTDRLPALTFFGQWVYCYLYGTLLSSIMSRYIFMQNFFQNGGDNNLPDNQ
ncbi:MAG: hypothetical protein IJ721_03870 [Bacteroidales bacterium]|nr:hypothetical protein [Bacteroidales bacterium]